MAIEHRSSPFNLPPPSRWVLKNVACCAAPPAAAFAHLQTRALPPLRILVCCARCPVLLYLGQGAVVLRGEDRSYRVAGDAQISGTWRKPSRLCSCLAETYIGNPSSIFAKGVFFWERLFWFGCGWLVRSATFAPLERCRLIARASLCAPMFCGWRLLASLFQLFRKL